VRRTYSRPEMIDGTPRIDVHAHVLPHEVMGAAGRYGPEIVDVDGLGALRVGPYTSRVGGGKGLTPEALHRLSDPAGRLRELDARSVDVMAISASPLLYLYWAEAELRLPFVAVLNDAMSRYCNVAPERLFFLAALPLPDIDASLRELDRACGLGARGVNIGTNDLGDGLELDSPELWPLYEQFEARRLPVFVHPHPLTMADGALDRYNLSWIVGYPYQETLALARLLLGGVFDDFPRLRVLLPHGGGNSAYQFGRLLEASHRQPDVRARRPLHEYLGNISFDILVHDLAARRLLVDFAGADQLVVGSNFGGWDAMDGFELLHELTLDPEAHRKISGANAVDLFGLSHARQTGGMTVATTGG
jgi:aminocarboxymuconate-semialdehyde decarboxylase